MAEKYYGDRDEPPYGVARLGDEYNLIDIFDKFPKREKNFTNFYGHIVTGVLLGLMIPVGYYKIKEIPLYRKPWATAFSTLLAAGCVYTTLWFGEQSRLRTEAVCRDYLQKHPEHFPPIKRKKFKDCLHPWHETRWTN